VARLPSARDASVVVKMSRIARVSTNAAVLKTPTPMRTFPRPLVRPRATVASAAVIPSVAQMITPTEIARSRARLH
jgi:hypothetical protein